LTSAQNKLGQFYDIAASETLIRSASFNEVPAEVVQELLQWLESRSADECVQHRGGSEL
jgi:hypothetical protein